MSKARKSRLLKHLKKCGFGDLIITLWLNWLKVVVGPLLMICGLFCDMANCGKKLGEIRNYVLFTNIALLLKLEFHFMKKGIELEKSREKKAQSPQKFLFKRY